MIPTIANVKVYATLESTVELPRSFSVQDFFTYLRENKFGGETHVNVNQGGITNIITRERIPITMVELDRLLAERKK